MHPSLLAGLAALVAASYWLLARRRPLLSDAIDAGAIAALNRAQIAWVAAAATDSPQGPDASHVAVAALALPSTARERAAFPRRLLVEMAGSTPRRLAAIETAARWGNRGCLPVLARGLRDVDPAVVRAAALAMERFRGRCSRGCSPSTQVAVPLPRNVARTR